MADRTTHQSAGVSAGHIRPWIVSLAVLAWLAGSPVLAQTGTAHVERKAQYYAQAAVA